ncbi:MAG: hypothetical protein ABJG41_09155 [Cyclobacteriaceae bacterium]
MIDSIQTTLEPFEFIEGFILSRFNYELDYRNSQFDKSYIDQHFNETITTLK